MECLSKVVWHGWKLTALKISIESAQHNRYAHFNLYRKKTVQDVNVVGQRGEGSLTKPGSLTIQSFEDLFILIWRGSNRIFVLKMYSITDKVQPSFTQSDKSYPNQCVFCQIHPLENSEVGLQRKLMFALTARTAGKKANLQMHQVTQSFYCSPGKYGKS